MRRVLLMLRWIGEILKKVIVNVLSFLIIVGVLWFFVLRHLIPF
jgi:hypothetical protein